MKLLTKIISLGRIIQQRTVDPKPPGPGTTLVYDSLDPLRRTPSCPGNLLLPWYDIVIHLLPKKRGSVTFNTACNSTPERTAARAFSHFV